MRPSGGGLPAGESGGGGSGAVAAAAAEEPEGSGRCRRADGTYRAGLQTPSAGRPSKSGRRPDGPFVAGLPPSPRPP